MNHRLFHIFFCNFVGKKRPNHKEQYGKQRTRLRLYTHQPQLPRHSSGAYQGAKYFSYNGKVLDEIRKEKEIL